MKIHEIDKPYSWLQWPVRLLNCDDKTLHVTAKFFGHAKINTGVVENWISNMEGLEVAAKLRRGPYHWQPAIFANLMHVLMLSSYPSELEKVHDRFNLIRDDWSDWKPHITVPKEYWDKVIANGWTANDEELMLGELELFIGTKTERD